VACSTGNDDKARAAKVIEILCKKGVIDQVSSNPVRSRLGTSLSYELILTAIRWRKQQLKDDNNKESDYASKNPSGALSTIADAGAALHAQNHPSGNPRAPSTIADIGMALDEANFPFDIIGNGALDFAQLDFGGLDADFNWWE
jgi:hypothetical protein